MSSTSQPQMGSREWRDSVFCSGPARDNKGRSKHTQYHQRYSPTMKRLVGGQGRNECCALLALDYLAVRGLVKRFKSQAFETSTKEFGAKIVPDFLVEHQDDSLIVVEQKTSRFLTRDKQLILDENKKKFAEFGLKYMSWTDRRPLNHAARHNLINMNRFSGENIPVGEIERLFSLVDEKRALPLLKVHEAGFDLSCIYAAAWVGKIFFPIASALSFETVITAKPQEDLDSIFLDCQRSTDEWWRS